MKPMIYLAGPISGLSYNAATDWRRDFATRVGTDIQCLDPMRGKEYLAREPAIRDSYPAWAMSTPRAINTRDFYDCTRSNLVVANLLGAEKVSIGTVLEIGWAFAYNIPTVLVMERAGNIHEHGMIRECTGFRVETLEEAAHIARVVLWP